MKFTRIEIRIDDEHPGWGNLLIEKCEVSDEDLKREKFHSRSTGLFHEQLEHVLAALMPTRTMFKDFQEERAYMNARKEELYRAWQSELETSTRFAEDPVHKAAEKAEAAG